RPWLLLRKLERAGMPAPRIAVVVASGPIVPWDEAEIAPGRIGARPLAATLRRVARDKRVAAVVLRVDAPGGSGMVSDLLWRDLRRLKDKKPLVVSMGSLAASGGYYLAMAADRVVATPPTLTGSIGVVAGKFDISGLMDKLGLKQEVLSYGRNTGIYSPTTGLTDAERERLQSFVEEFYEVFVGKAADCRGVGRDELEEHARGRIWTGTQALARGLVDKTGGLDTALAEAAQLAQLGVTWDTCWVESPRPGLVARLQSLVPVVRTGLGVVEEAREDLLVSRPDLVQARLPVDLRFL
ncbi:MAG: signal peptide peptidase SppA, partial [Myxococcota bacterium]|nr:signal peptide peptidase SppA [Myxococcota bacterium]